MTMLRTFSVGRSGHSGHSSRAARGALLLAIGVFASACAISQQQEVQMGAQYATQIDTQLPIVRDAQVVSYINTLGNSLAKLADTRGLVWRFAVVDSKEVNAFAVPGGWVYINRGLIARAQTMDELAGVVGHEIGHITLRHSVQQMQQSQRVGGGLMALCTLTKVCESGAGQTAINLGGSALFASFSRQDEAQADDEGVRTLVKAGIDPQGMPKMFRILLSERQSNPGAVDAFFSTHPLAEDRITATTKQIASYAPSAVRGLVVDNEAFRSVKRRLASLPPSPAPRVVGK
jgi:predicted Zn-dependent protease